MKRKIEPTYEDMELSYIRSLITSSFFGLPRKGEHLEVIEDWKDLGRIDEEGSLTSLGKTRVRELQYYLDTPGERTNKLLFLLGKALPYMKVTPRNRTFLRKVERVLKFHPRDPRDLLSTSEVTRLRNLLVKHIRDYENRIPRLPGGYPPVWEIQRLLTNGPVRHG